MVPGKLTGFDRQTMGDVLMATGTNVSRYGLVIVLLWIGGTQIHGLRGRGHPADGGEQSADELGIRGHEQGGILSAIGRDRDCHRAAHRASHRSGRWVRRWAADSR